MRNLRPVAGVLFSAFLSLTLVLATVSSAIAHVQMATGQVVDICAGADTITLTLDAQGNPVTAMGICPDCMPGLNAALLPGGFRGLGLDGQGRALVFSLGFSQGQDRSLPSETARGPPLLV